MSDLLDLILSFSPDADSVGVPLLSDIVITLSGEDYNHDSLEAGIFIEGPDTDQYVGPGLLYQDIPKNVSQGNLDDFLQSPGYKGLVSGDITVTGVGGNTIVTFDPTQPLAALTDYIVNLTGILDVLEDEIDGFVTFSFTTGTGSIEELPSIGSLSVLNSVIAESSSPGDPSSPLSVVFTTPANHDVQQPTTLSEIVVHFSNELDPDSVEGQVTVETFPATDHPSASTNSQGTLAKTLIVEGKVLTIKI